MKKISILILSFLLLMSASQAMAELRIDSVSPNVGQLGEELQVTIKGGGFTTDTRVSMSVDVGNAKSVIGYVEAAGRVFRDVTVVGDIAYVAQSGGGLNLVDISDLSNPSEIIKVDTPGSANRVEVAEGMAYVADLSGGLQIIDVSDPGNP